MTRSVRFYWRGKQGRNELNVNWPPVNVDSTVKVVASEWAEDPGNPGASPRFVGDANITVRNVVPHGPPSDPNHGVTFIVDVDWPAPLNIVTDIVLFDDVPRVQHPPLDWHRLAFAVQAQQQTNWCWSAVTVSITNFYGASLTQCGLADTLLGQTTCCVNGSSAACNVTQNTMTAIVFSGRYASVKIAGPTIDEARTEIDNGRPIALRIQWVGGGRHAIALGGYLARTDFVAVDDPANGPSDVLIDTLNTNYLSAGSVFATVFTRS